MRVLLFLGLLLVPLTGCGVLDGVKAPSPSHVIGERCEAVNGEDKCICSGSGCVCDNETATCGCQGDQCECGTVGDGECVREISRIYRQEGVTNSACFCLDSDACFVDTFLAACIAYDEDECEGSLCENADDGPGPDEGCVAGDDADYCDCFGPSCSCNENPIPTCECIDYEGDGSCCFKEGMAECIILPDNMGGDPPPP